MFIGYSQSSFLNREVIGGRKMKVFRSAAVAMLLLQCQWAPAQTITGSIQGTIRDESGAAVPGVGVTVQNVNTQAARNTISNESGNYDVALLPPGNYTISAE